MSSPLNRIEKHVWTHTHKSEQTGLAEMQEGGLTKVVLTKVMATLVNSAKIYTQRHSHKLLMLIVLILIYILNLPNTKSIIFLK